MKCEICLLPVTKAFNCNLCPMTLCSSQCTLSHFSQTHNNTSETSTNSALIQSKIPKPSLIQNNQLTSLVKCGTFLQVITYPPEFSINNLTQVYSKGAPVILGTGTFGQVYLARHNLNGNFYAIKHMSKPRLMAALNSLTTIYNEIDIHSRLVHENVIKILSVNETPQAFDLIMEYANGGSLFGLIKRNNGLSERNAHKFFMQVATAVNFLHENNIIHRDLKPENILLDGKDDNKAKLCDFGWSIELSSRNRSTYCGTMEYMAPEIVNKANYDKSIDAWSLGVLLYELTHGYSPFRAIYNTNDSNEVVSNIKSKHFKYDKAISKECKELINGLLNEDPVKRLKCSEIFTHPFAFKFLLEKERNDVPPIQSTRSHSRQKSISFCNKEWVNKRLNSSSIERIKSQREEALKRNECNEESKASSEMIEMKALIKKQKSIQLSNAKERISQISIEKKNSMNCFEDILAYSTNKTKSELSLKIASSNPQSTSKSTSISSINKRMSVESILPELFDDGSSSTAPSIKQANKIVKVFDMKHKIAKEEDKKQKEPSKELEIDEEANSSIISKNFLEKITQPSLDMTKRGLSEAIKLINKCKGKEQEMPQRIRNELSNDISIP